jgi:hypothetical protein
VLPATSDSGALECIGDHGAYVGANPFRTVSSGGERLLAGVVETACRPVTCERGWFNCCGDAAHSPDA